MKRGATFKRKKQNKLALFLVTFVMLFFVGIVTVNSYSLRQKRDILLQKEADLNAQLEEQDERKQELVELKKYTQTKKYAEEVAKEKLGLVYEDEIIFKPQD